MKQEIIILQPELVPHHEIASLHRDMSSEEFESIKLSIEQEGQLVPIITYRGKLVDGRHRQRALIELGIHDMKCISLPNNISLDEVRNKVLGTEMRRADTVAQKAIRAYKWIKDTGSTQEEAAIKFGTSQTYVSQAKRLEELVGSVSLNKMYNHGYLFIGEKRHTQLRTALNQLGTNINDQKDREPLSEPVAEVFEIIRTLDKTDDMVGISQIESYAKQYRQRKD